MAKISLLPDALDLDGSELVPIVQGGATRQASFGGAVATLAQPFVVQAQAASDQAADLVRAENTFVDVSLAAAEAAVADGTYFKLVDSAAGTAEIRLRNADGSALVYTEITRSALASNGADKGASMVGMQGGGTAEQGLSGARGPTLAEAVLLTIPAAFTAIQLSGHSAPGLGKCLYRRVAGEPGHGGKFQSGDGAWWELAEEAVTPQMFGAAADDGSFAGTNDLAAIKLAFNVACALGVPLRINRPHYAVAAVYTDPIEIPATGGVIEFEGLGRIRWGNFGLPLFWNQDGVGRIEIRNANLIGDYTTPLTVNKPAYVQQFYNALGRGAGYGFGNSVTGMLSFLGSADVEVSNPRFTARTLENDKLITVCIMAGEGANGAKGAFKVTGTSTFDGIHFGILAWAYKSLDVGDILADHWGQLSVAGYAGIATHVIYCSVQGDEDVRTTLGDVYDLGTEVAGIDFTLGSCSVKFTSQGQAIRTGNLYSLRAAGILDINGSNFDIASLFWKGDSAAKLGAGKPIRIGLGLYDGYGRTANGGKFGSVYLHIPDDHNNTVIFSEYGCYNVNFGKVTIRHDGTSQQAGIISGPFGNCDFDVYLDMPNTITAGAPTFINIQNGGDNNRVTMRTNSPQFKTMRVIESDKVGSTGNTALITGILTGEERRLTPGHELGLYRVEARLAMTAGATLTAANLIPRGANVIALTSTISTAAGTSAGLTGYKLGTAADDDLYGVRTGVGVGGYTGNAQWTADASGVRIAAESVIVTAVGGNFDGTGEILIVANYFIGAPYTDLL
ncbi:hypothetical protein [Sphingomonas sp. IC081]|uniref:hypothetical protein n=1 Tax=Sphingomonas sp. IC081 TaxID=304378 RepID=UPI001158C8BC|nr:hypothetical protein [Sphingomonas sp. IC081]QDK34538.1 hypothetical protein DM450_17510 [Sphingomonas sp. IC081]